jgi:hypothetical protein
MVIALIKKIWKTNKKQLFEQLENLDFIVKRYNMSFIQINTNINYP